MKTVLNKLAVFLMITLCCLSLTSASTARAASGEEWKMSSSSSLNMRSSASTSASVIEKIPAGTTYTVTQKVTTDSYLWGKVTYNGKTGWCSLRYLVYLDGEVYETSESGLDLISERIATETLKGESMGGGSACGNCLGSRCICQHIQIIGSV